MEQMIYVVYTYGYDTPVERPFQTKYAEWGIFDNIKALKIFAQYLVNSAPNILPFKIRLPDGAIMSLKSFCEIFHIEKQSFNERIVFNGLIH